MTFTVSLPPKNGAGANELITSPDHIVLVGANGAGKTRLGIWIEEVHQNNYPVHRISAQKALAIPEFAPLKALEQAEKDLMYGRSDIHAHASQKNQMRWGGTPATFLLSDYDKLLSVLFAREAARDRQHTEDSRSIQGYVPVPDSPIDTIAKIWGDIMPHREIKFVDGKILAKRTGDAEYHGKDMSDGERVVLYLIGQCLCAPENAMIIIDEPEIHVHKSLVDKLWNKIEELCQGKRLVYITHDLAFAASRTDALKIWIQTYNGSTSWTWTEVPSDEMLPESLVLEVIGSRKKIMFCEGTTGSFDVTMYQIAYAEYHVIPRGSCTEVIESTKALRNNASLHHMAAVGIIDSDYRDQEEITALSAHGVHTIAVAEIENIFCVESVLRIIADHLGLNPDDVVAEVTRYIASALNQEIEVQVSSMAERRIQYLLGAFSKASNDKAGLSAGLTKTVSRIEVESIYDTCKAQFDKALSSYKLDDLLRIYNRKSLPNRISPCLGLGSGEYQKLLVRLMKGSKREIIVAALKQHMPIVP